MSAAFFFFSFYQHVFDLLFQIYTSRTAIGSKSNISFSYTGPGSNFIRTVCRSFLHFIEKLFLLFVVHNATPLSRIRLLAMTLQTIWRIQSNFLRFASYILNLKSIVLPIITLLYSSSLVQRALYSCPLCQTVDELLV